MNIYITGKGQIKRQNSGLPRMESLARIGCIPLVESGVKTAEHVYIGLKVNADVKPAEAIILICYL